MKQLIDLREETRSFPLCGGNEIKNGEEEMLLNIRNFRRDDRNDSGIGKSDIDDRNSL